MISLRSIATLSLSAASGLVRDGERAYVVADDEHVLDAYRIDTGAREARWPLGLGPELPADPAQRKRHKPDLETLCHLPGRRLLALGSGSSRARRRGVLVALDATGGPAAQSVDLSPLYLALERHFPQLNIEGAAAAGPWLRLLQRGNGAQSCNAVIDLALDATLRALALGEPFSEALIRAIRPVELGRLSGVPLAFTDASPLDPADAAIGFVAAAEDTDNPYDDGACAGSAVGLLDAEARVAWLEPIAGALKIEGLAATPGRPVLMVADPDDRAQAAPLLEGPACFG